jgi:hypothetical protein
VIDESPPLTVTFTANKVGDSAQSIQMSELRGTWSGAIALDPGLDAGEWNWTITAIDAFGNRSTSSGFTDVRSIHC